MTLKRLRVLFFATVVTVFALWSCQSDTPTAANTSAENNTSLTVPADGQEGDMAADPTQLKAGAIAKAKELEQGIIHFQDKLQDLRKQVNAIPGAKQVATDFEELEVRLDGYMEKGSYVQSEVKQLIQELSDTGPNDITASKLVEQADNLEAFQAAGAVLEKAVEQLKNAKGKKVRLFE